MSLVSRNREEFSEERKRNIVAGLLQLARERHVFDGVWLKHDRLFVKRHALGDLEYMSWREAARLVEPAKKPNGKAAKLAPNESERAPRGVAAGNGRRTR